MAELGGGALRAHGTAIAHVGIEFDHAAERKALHLSLGAFDRPVAKIQLEGRLGKQAAVVRLPRFTHNLAAPGEHVVDEPTVDVGAIDQRQHCRVEKLLASPSGETVSGAHYENDNGASETIATDLVVDASGSGALTLNLLQSIGRPLPEETTIGIDLGYATCVFGIPDDAPADWKGVMTFGQAPHNSRGGLMLPIEGNRWMATIGGRHGDVPSGDAEGFLAYARALRTPTIYDAISHAKRLGGVARYGFRESVRRHFERFDKFPCGLLPIADAICRFNPVYGQGMSVAAQEACLLRTLLGRSVGDSNPIAALAPTFFAEVQTLIETPWAVATLDFVFPETRGQRPADFETVLKFGIALTRLAAEDPAVHKLTAEVQNLLVV